MFEGIKRNIRETRERLRDLNLGRTLARLRAARVHRNRKKRARRELLDERDKALAEWERLIGEGRESSDEHLRNLRTRAAKADAHADELGEVQADLTRLYRALKAVARKKHEARKRLEAQLRERRANLRRARREFRRRQQSATGTTVVDDKPVASWIAAHVLRVRAAGIWNGVAISGWRDPDYSEQLCFQICGARTCPGRCAGRSSSHSQTVNPNGAVDVSDPATFGAECRRLGIPLRNALAGSGDPWHYSTTGG